MPTPIVPAALLSLACVAGGVITVVATAAADGSPAAKARTPAAPSLTDALAEVQDLSKAGRGAEAMRRLDVLIASHPTDARLRFQKGVMLTDQKRAAEAIVVFQKLMRDYPALPEPMNNLAVLYVERGEMEKARTTLEAAIRSKPNYGTAFQNLGDLYTRMASRAYARALQIDDAEGAPKLALIRNLYEAPPTEGDVTLMAQVNTQAPAAPLSVPSAGAAPSRTASVAENLPLRSPLPAPSSPVPTGRPAPAPSPAARAAPASAPVISPANVPPPLIAAAAASPAAASASSPTKASTPAPSTAVAGSRPASATSAAAVPAASISAASTPGKALPAASGAAVARAASAGSAAAAAAQPAKPPPKPASAPPAATAATDVADVNAALRAWAGAWSRREMAAYLGAYVPGFKGSDASADAWQAGRRARILGKTSIRVDVSAVKVEIDKGVASASFRQAYAAGGLDVNSRKTLEFVRVNGRWLIRRESVGG